MLQSEKKKDGDRARGGEESGGTRFRAARMTGSLGDVLSQLLRMRDSREQQDGNLALILKDSRNKNLAKDKTRDEMTNKHSEGKIKMLMAQKKQNKINS